MLPATPKESEPSSLVSHQTSQHFSLDEIRAATQNFNEALVIGCGGFGKVYKGHINHGSVAIKRLNSKSHQGAPEFWAEVQTLSKLRHCNLVSLIGYCRERREMILVYDYMPNGTLADCLHKAGVALSWLQRLKICIGAARGLDYLHTGTGTQNGVIHRDVKSSNILLDETFAAKLSDFGLAKIGPTNQTCTFVSTVVKGTFGYMDSCYFYTGKLTRKSDVYSFGVVLLEVLCGKRAVDSSLDEEQWSLAAWAQDHIKEGKLNRITDSRIRDQISSICLKEFAHIACRCLHNQRNKRPTMTDIITRLEHILSSQKKLGSPLTDGKFINKLRWFFPATVLLKASKRMSPPTAITEGEPIVKAAEQLIHFGESSFTVKDLLQADSFVIARSSYWMAYKAYMRNGDQLVVRRMKGEILLKEDIILVKIQALGKLCHPNILGPKAYYQSKDERVYITDYIQNGSISSFLHPSAGQLHKTLGWWTRMSIIVGITRGLVYLHTQENMVHGHLTSGNVLLDTNYNPMIADVGLLLHLTDDAGQKSTLNHAPELLKFKDANMKTDVYSLGLIMLELLTRKSAKSKKEGIDNLYAWVMSIPREELEAQVFDPELIREKIYIKQEWARMLELAMACVSVSPDDRPTADEVLPQLEEIMAIAKEEREKMNNNIKIV